MPENMSVKINRDDFIRLILRGIPNGMQTRYRRAEVALFNQSGEVGHHIGHGVGYKRQALFLDQKVVRFGPSTDNWGLVAHVLVLDERGNTLWQGHLTPAIWVYADMTYYVRFEWVDDRVPIKGWQTPEPERRPPPDWRDVFERMDL